MASSCEYGDEPSGSGATDLVRWNMRVESHGGTILTGENRIIVSKTCSSATLSIANNIYIRQGTNPFLRGETRATNCLCHGTDYAWLTIRYLQ
jgi:hypothetical protein